MAYEALTRKWRPKTFAEVVGQVHVTRALANAIALGKVHHAYLFAGTRGVGKTTFARILARALNCEKGPTPDPCMTCPACVEVLSGAAVDVQEIDGASHTGIDDVRRLREGAAYAPARLRYKVYIIDEVHMLSKQAFNGLLKIIEEPPPHVVFVLATTEPARIPETILSRVQRFDFRMLTEEEIQGRLREMAAAEGIAAEEEALRLVARYAFGSMRDGQSIVEQAAVAGGGAITAALVEEALGLVGTEAAMDLVGAVAGGETEEAIRRFGALLARGGDLKYLYLAVIDVLRDAAVWRFTESDGLLARHSPSSLPRMKALAARKSREEWMFLLDIAFRSERDVLGTEFPRLGFELLLMRLASAPVLLAVEALDAPPAPDVPLAPAARSSGAPAPPASRPAEPPPPRPAATFSRRPAPPAPAPGRARREEGLWEAVRRSLEAKKKAVLVALTHQMKGRMEGEEFVVTGPHQMQLDRLRDDDKWPFFLQAVEEAAGRKVPVRLAVEGAKKGKAPDPPASAGGPERKALDDPLLSEALREFEGATVVEIRPSATRPPAAAGGETAPEDEEAADAAPEEEAEEGPAETEER